MKHKDYARSQFTENRLWVALLGIFFWNEAGV